MKHAPRQSIERLISDRSRQIIAGSNPVLGAAIICCAIIETILTVRLYLNKIVMKITYKPSFYRRWQLNQADIHRMTESEDWKERKEAVIQIRHNFSTLPNKKQAWEDLIRMTLEGSWEAADALYTVFPYVSDKNQAWNDLVHILIQDKKINEINVWWENRIAGVPDLRWQVAYTLEGAFPYTSDKEQAWNDLHRLSKDKDVILRVGAAKALGVAILHLYDKESAWRDLHNLMHDEITDVRWYATKSLGIAFPHIPDKKEAWEDLICLQQDENISVRWCAAKSLGTAFSHMHNKEQAWEDLHNLMQNKEIDVRKYVAESIGIAFPRIPNKEQAWEDLIILALDENIYVRVYANYSLGRVSIFKATIAESEETFRKEIEKAIEFLEKSSKESISDNPASFCLPFYRTFYAVTFKKKETESEVQKYLSEAKNAVRGSECKQKLLEAVENLSNALREAQSVHEMDFNAIKCDLNAYRRYCERAADLLDETEEKAPGATKLIKKGLPIIDQRIKEIITEIQENAKALCKQTKNTQLEDLGKEVNRAGQTFPQIRDPIGLEKSFINLWTALSSICAKMPEEERGEACELLKKAGDEPYIEDKLPL